MGGRSIDVCEWCGDDVFDDIPCHCDGSRMAASVGEACELIKNSFTVDEIREWLEGWYMLNPETKERVGSLDLSTILVLLDCDQDGIAAWRRRRAMENEKED